MQKYECYRCEKKWEKESEQILSNFEKQNIGTIFELCRDCQEKSFYEREQGICL